MGASPARRWIGVICLIALGVVFAALVFQPGGVYARLFFLGLAISSFLMADRLRQSTADEIELTKNGLRTSSGLQLVTLKNVRAVERGALAFKPSNGFLVRMHEPEGRGWAPGLWWKRGRMLGVGGVVSGGQARAMAELLTALHQGYDLDFMKGGGPKP